MGKIWLVVAEFDDCDISLQPFASEKKARNIARIYVGNFDRMWVDNWAIHKCSKDQFCGVRVVEFVNGIRQSQTRWFSVAD